jgi:drug/metabolite transporter (DMT)-like permease
VLRSTSATVVSLAVLFEVPGAILIAALWLGQVPPLAILPAVVLLFAGLVLVIRSGGSGLPTETPPV